jgi:hypothetical protein
MSAAPRNTIPARYTDHLKLRVQPVLREAIELAAAQNLTTPSEYVRRHVLEGLRADGIDPSRLAAA